MLWDGITLIFVLDTHGDFVEKTATEESSEVDGDKPNNEDNEDKQD